MDVVCHCQGLVGVGTDDVNQAQLLMAVKVVEHCTTHMSTAQHSTGEMVHWDLCMVVVLFVAVCHARQ